MKYIQRQKEDKNVKISVRDGITEEELLKLYETFLDKIRHSIYGVRLSSQEKRWSMEKRNLLISPLKQSVRCCMKFCIYSSVRVEHQI